MYGKKHKMKAKADRMMKINAVKARMAKKKKGKGKEDDEEITSKRPTKKRIEEQGSDY